MFLRPLYYFLQKDVQFHEQMSIIHQNVEQGLLQYIQKFDNQVILLNAHILCYLLWSSPRKIKGDNE